jgi:hypothetical protein
VGVVVRWSRICLSDKSDMLLSRLGVDGPATGESPDRANRERATQAATAGVRTVISLCATSCTSSSGLVYCVRKLLHVCRMILHVAYCSTCSHSHVSMCTPACRQCAAQGCMMVCTHSVLGQ